MRRFLIVIALTLILAMPGYAFSPNDSAPGNGQIQQLQSLHFNVFFYVGDDSLANHTMRIALQGLNQIEEKIGFRLNGKLDIFLLNDPEAVNPEINLLNSSNRELTNGSTATLNQRIQLNKHSSFENLEIQIRKGIALNLIHEMLYGGTAQERIKYATLLHLPDWFVAGLVEYCAVDWNEKLDQELRNALLHNHFKNINRLTPQQSALLGHSLWKYIDERKGENPIRRTLYSVRFSKKLENAFHFIFNQSSKELISEWSNYQTQIHLKPSNYINPLKPEDLNFDNPDIHILHYQLSPDASKIALTTYNKGFYRVLVWNREDNSFKEWMSIGKKNHAHKPTLHQALIEWKNEDQLFVIVRKPNRSGQFESKLLLVEPNSVETIDDWQDVTVNSFDYDGKGKLALLGQNNGHSHLKIFDLGTQQVTPLANSKEYWSNVCYSFNHQAVMFSSSNLDHSNEGNWQSDLKVILIDHPETVTKLTNTPLINESFPVPISNTEITYLSDKNGINNAYQLNLLDFKSEVITNYRLGVASQNGNQNFDFIIELIRSGTRDYIYVSENSKVSREEITEPHLTHYRIDKLEKHQSTMRRDSVERARDKADTYFQLDFPEKDVLEPATNKEQSKGGREQGWDRIPFKNKLSIESIATQINNTNIFSDRFTPFLPPEQQIKQRYGVLLGVELADIQRNNKLQWSVRTFPSFNRWDLRLNYAYQKNNWLNQVEIWRQSQLLTSTTQYRKNVGSQLSYSLARRVNHNMIFALSTNYRNEEYIELSTEAVDLTTKNSYQRNLGLSGRLQYERLLSTKHNAYDGIKAFLEVDHQQNLGGTGSFLEAKVDFRFGWLLNEELSWMSRIHAATNTGKNRMVYFLGGIENANSNEFKNLTYLANSGTAYFVPVYGVRGHAQNVRNGNSFTYFNTEIRWDMAETILKYPNPNQVIQKLSLVGFFDMGSAWYGSSPYSRDNPLNTQQISTPVFDITRYNPQQPLVFGWGGGIRSQLYSYFIKYDVAKGWDNGVWGPVLHTISLGKDF